MALTSQQRKNILQRANFTCEYCKTPELFSGLALEIDHIVPQSDAGEDTPENTCAACRSCNKYKHGFQTATDPQTDKDEPLFNPRTQNWHEHLSWNEDFTEITETSAIGRATVERLKLNNAIIIRARAMWRKAGWTPPQD